MRHLRGGGIRHTAAGMRECRGTASRAIRLAAVVTGAIVFVGCRAPASVPPAPSTLPFAADTLRSVQVRDGVLHRFIYSSEGPWAIHVLEASRDQCWSLAALKSQGGAIGREATSALAQNAAAGDEIAGAVNADFFLFTPPGVPVGMLVTGGRLITGPVAQPVLAVDSTGAVHIARFEVRGHAAVTGRRLELTAWNRDAVGGLAFFDRQWGARTDTASGVIEVVLDGAPAYRVIAVDTASAGVAIPSGGAVLKAGRQAPLANRSALSALAPGTAVSTVIALDPFHPREAVGGRPWLVRDGLIAVQLDTVGRAGFATGRHPRTAAGFSRDGARILLVTVDGRQAPYSDGMSLRELAELMLALGASESLNLDGGGSTAMVIAGEGSGSDFRVVNRPSDQGGERAVGNAVGLVRRCVR